MKNLFSKAEEHCKSLCDVRYLNDQARKYGMSSIGNLVGIIGQPGVGKTTLSKQILAKVIDENLYEAEYVFYLQFRSVNYKKKNNLLSFLGVNLSWVFEEKQRKAVLDKLSNNKNVVMIFDGLDEAILKHLTSIENIQPHEEEKPEIFIKNILQGSIFPQAKKLITSRPRQMFELPKNLIPSYIVNITGLEVEAQKQICQEICGNNADIIFNHIIHRPQIASYCYVPANCILVMHVMDKIFQSKAFDIPNSITRVLVIVVCLFEQTSHARGKFSLEKLSRLAWNGLKNRTFYFTEKNLIEAGFTPDENVFFLVTILAENNKLNLFGGDPEKITYFAHLIIQEFFAALNLIFFSSSTNFRKLFLGRHLGHFQLSKPTFDLFASSWEMVTQFLFGLGNKQTLKLLCDAYPSLQLGLSDKVKNLCNFVLCFLPSCSALSEVEYFQKILRFCTWAFELNDKKFASRVAQCLRNQLIIVGKFLPNDVAPIHYVLRHRTKPLNLDTTPFDSWFVGDSLGLFLEEMPNTIAAASSVSVRCIIA